MHLISRFVVYLLVTNRNHRSIYIYFIIYADAADTFVSIILNVVTEIESRIALKLHIYVVLIRS